MALEIHRLRDQEPAGDSGPLVADRRLFLAADEMTVVEEDDPRAAFLLCGPGATLHVPDVRRLRLVVEDGRVVQAAASAIEAKAAVPAEDKQLEAGEDKAAGPPPAKGGKRKKGLFGRGG